MKHTIIPAVHLFLFQEGKIHLLRRYKTGWEDGNWVVIAGHVENHETPTEAMIREAREEAGIDIMNPVCAHVMHRLEDNGDRVDYFFTAESWTGDIDIREADKCDAMEWFPIQDLPGNTVPCIREAIDHFQKGILYSERDEREQK